MPEAPVHPDRRLRWPNRWHRSSRTGAFGGRTAQLTIRGEHRVTPIDSFSGPDWT